jgi:hypothetical protein
MNFGLLGLHKERVLSSHYCEKILQLASQTPCNKANQTKKDLSEDRVLQLVSHSMYMLQAILVVIPPLCALAIVISHAIFVQTILCNPCVSLQWSEVFA